MGSPACSCSFPCLRRLPGAVDQFHQARTVVEGGGFGQHDVRLDARKLEGERRTATEEARLHLVDDEHEILARAEVANKAQVVKGRRPHAALALHAL